MDLAGMGVEDWGGRDQLCNIHTTVTGPEHQSGPCDERWDRAANCHSCAIGHYFHTSCTLNHKKIRIVNFTTSGLNASAKVSPNSDPS